MKTGFGILVILGIVVLTSCNHMGTLSVMNQPDIIVHVSNAGSAGITTPGSAKCKVVNQGKNGCIHMDQNDTGLIKFKLTGPPGWAFATFEICKILPDESKVCNLNVWERLEFAATTDSPGANALLPAADGRVILTDLSAGLREFLLLDQNRIEQEYYYRVEVCDGSTCTWADPPLENGGMK